MEQNFQDSNDRSSKTMKRQFAQAVVNHNYIGKDVMDHEWLSALGHDIETVRERQRNYFLSGQTLSYQFRKQALLRLRQMIKTHEKN